MKFHVTLKESDHLQHLLYTASKNPSIKRNRTRTWLVLSLCSLLLGWLFYRSHNMVLTYYFLTAGVALLCFYPFYQQYYYKKYYRKLAVKRLMQTDEQGSDISFSDDYLEAYDSTSEMKMRLSEIEEIIELKDQYFLKIRASDKHVVIPKPCLQVSDPKGTFMHELANRLSIPYTSDTDWKWR